jgi:hypothetical protein
LLGGKKRKWTLIDSSVENILTSRRVGEEFILPSYDDFCLSNVPSTISSLFGVKTTKQTRMLDHVLENIAISDPQNVLLMILDGFGYDMWLRKTSDGGFFEALTNGGFVFPITTVFPSTTAAALTTISTGLTPQEHGLPEWYVYINDLDMVIKTLPFSPIGEERPDTLLPYANPEILFSGETMFSSLQRWGIYSVSILPKENSKSAYTRVSLKGSEVIPYRTLAEFGVMIKKKLKISKQKTLVSAYWDSVDSTGHEYGPDADESEAERLSFSYVLKKEFLNKIERDIASKTLLIVTADHGMVGVSPKDVVYLNEYPKVVSAFARGRNGKPIPPSWGPRDVVLHLQQEKIEEVQTALKEIFDDDAMILRTKEAIDMGLFGVNEPSRQFIQRSGDLLVLPSNNHLVWYEHIKGSKFDLLGMHGGLTKKEMLVPFAISKLSDVSNT